MLSLQDFDYTLPPELIAQTPAEERADSRLLVYHRDTRQIEHRHFRDLPEYLSSQDVLVMNSSRVLPARLFPKTPRGEIFLLKAQTPNVWQVLVRPGKRFRVEQKVVFDGLSGTIVSVEPDGTRLLEFEVADPLPEILRLGQTPLPPYIHATADPARYQTVYSDILGSVAAPTAGLHFTPELLDTLRARGVTTEKVLLHVGLGTFRPVQTESLTDHVMHSEAFTLEDSVATRLNAAHASGKRLVTVGTTSVRVLESCADADGVLTPRTGDTDIFIYPPYTFRAVGALITNFHLPKSTLLMLVSAFVGLEECRRIYAEAIREKYRFYSFGDACLFL